MYNFDQEQLNRMLDRIEDPTMRNMIEVIMNRNMEQQTKSTHSFEKNKYPSITREKAINDVKLCLEKIRVLKEDVLELHTEMNNLLSFQKTLAGALGACYCMGEDANCEICFGSGRPGSRIINEAAFQKYVYPLFQTLTKATETVQPVIRKDIPTGTLRSKTTRNGSAGKDQNNKQ